MRGAKELYLISYGEDNTFREKHVAYSCRSVELGALPEADGNVSEDRVRAARQEAKEAAMNWISDAAQLHGLSVPAGWSGSVQP